MTRHFYSYPLAKVDRNLAMFEQWKVGRKKTDIAKEFGVTLHRVEKICRQLERWNGKDWKLWAGTESEQK